MSLSIYKKKVNDLIDIYVDKINDGKMREMIRYSLEGGKRLRSIICLYIFDNYSQCNDEIVIAVELLHNASLILDDLPCMDNDDYRRNRLSFHKKFGVMNAYLVSNYLFCEFNKIIGNLNNENLLKYVFEKLNLILVGQYYDLFPDTNTQNDLDKKIYNNNLKTTPFFVLSFFIPLYLCDCNISKYDIEKMAISFSTAFQIYDDFLDEKQDIESGNFSHIKYLGREYSYTLYLDNLKIFRESIKHLKIKGDLFEEIINYLNTKLRPYLNDIQSKEA
jgi:geranylgeranyl diphosphate synthase, type II